MCWMGEPDGFSAQSWGDGTRERSVGAEREKRGSIRDGVRNGVCCGMQLPQARASRAKVTSRELQGVDSFGDRLKECSGICRI